MIALNLIFNLRNPFANTAGYAKFYHLWVWGFALATTIWMIAKHQYGESGELHLSSPFSFSLSLFLSSLFSLMSPLTNTQTHRQAQTHSPHQTTTRTHARTRLLISRSIPGDGTCWIKQDDRKNHTNWFQLTFFVPLLIYWVLAIVALFYAQTRTSQTTVRHTHATHTTHDTDKTTTTNATATLTNEHFIVRPL